MKKSLLFGGIFIVVVFAVALALPAQADGPDYRDTLTWVDHEVHYDLCSFPVVRHAEYMVKVKGWADENGDIFKHFESYGNSREVFYRDEEENSLRSLVQGPVKYEMVAIDEMMATWNGPFSLVVVPGHGPAFGFTGQLTITYNFTTQETVLVKNTFPLIYDAEDMQAFCDYLAGE